MKGHAPSFIHQHDCWSSIKGHQPANQPPNHQSGTWGSAKEGVFAWPGGPLCDSVDRREVDKVSRKMMLTLVMFYWFLFPIASGCFWESIADKCSLVFKKLTAAVLGSAQTKVRLHHCSPAHRWLHRGGMCSGIPEPWWGGAAVEVASITRDGKWWMMVVNDGG